MGRLRGISMLARIKLDCSAMVGIYEHSWMILSNPINHPLATVQWQRRIVVVEASFHPIPSYLGSSEVRLRTYHGEQSTGDSCRSNCAKNDQPEKTSTVLPRSHLQQGLLCFDRHC